MRRSSLRAALLLLLYLCLPLVVHADTTSASVAPASLNAGVVNDVAVTFTSGVDVEVGGSVLIEFPTGFHISSGTTVSVTTTGSTTTLSVTSVSSPQLSVLVGTTKISAGVAFGFSVTDVTNPAAQTTSDFLVSTYDSSNALLERNTAISGITIVSSTLSGAAVAPDSLNAGATGTATVAFTSAVRLPVGSKVEVSFPSDFMVASSTLSSVTNIDSSSTLRDDGHDCRQRRVGRIQRLVQAGRRDEPRREDDGYVRGGNDRQLVEDIPAGDGVSAATIVNTVLSGVSVGVDNDIAGALSMYSVDFTTNAGIPLVGYVVLLVPPDYSLSGSISLVDSLVSATWTGIVDGQSIKFKALAPYAVGQHSIQVKFLENPGASTTGSFKVSTTDANGFLLESASCAGVTIVPGSITDAVFTPQLAHPGIASRVDISFTTSAGLAKNSLLIIQLPSGDYDAECRVYRLWSQHQRAPVLLPRGIFNDHSARHCSNITSDGIRNAAIDTSNSYVSINSELECPGSETGRFQYTNSQCGYCSPSLPCAWSTETPNPGITSNVLVTFKTNGKIPVGGKIVLKIPPSDFYADSSGNAPSVVFKSPSTVVATATWDTANAALELVVANDSLPAYQVGVQVKIMKLDTPVSVRTASRLPASLTTFDPLGIAIDGPSVLEMDAITAGFILGSRLWTAVNAVAGVTSDQTIDFFITGRMDPGGKFEFTLPDTKWSMAAAGVATFIAPNLSDVGTVVWDAPTRMMTVTLTGTTSIPSYSGVTLRIRGVSNPPKETGINNAYLTTRAADNRIIDGPDTISVMTIARGTLAGVKTWTSITTTSASMQSDQRLRFTLIGALPSVSLPGGGWRMVNNAVVSVSFTLPVSGVTVQSVNWSPTTYELSIATIGDMSEGTVVELIVKDMVNPYSSSVAGKCTVTTMLPDSGAVAESKNIVVNAITSDVLPTEGSFISNVATPGVLSTQTITLTTGGKLESGAKFCITITDEWTLMASTSASLTVTTAMQSSPLTREFNATTNTLCMQTAVAIDQETVVTIALTDILSPESIRPEQLAKLGIQSHLGGDVNTGSIRMNAINKGALTGPLTWQPQVLSPGPVAGLRTSSNLAFKTTGQVAAGGSILVELPFEWVMSSTCKATFVHPPVLGRVSCSQNNISILMVDDLVEAMDVNISFTGVYNPPLVMSEGVASCRTIAPDGGVIDESNAITTGAIAAAVTGITNSGDHLTAVVGLLKYLFLKDLLWLKVTSSSSWMRAQPATPTVANLPRVNRMLGCESRHFVKFTQSSQDGKPFAICYKFGDNPFKLYSTLSIMVKEIKFVSSNVGFPDIAVANFVKTWTFNGNGISAGDQMRWIDLDVAQSAAYISTHRTVWTHLHWRKDDYTRVIQKNSNVSFAFSVESSGKTFCLCYKFGKEPFMVYPAIKMQFLGDGVALNDRLYFVELGSVLSCEESDNDVSLRLLHWIADQEQSVQPYHHCQFRCHRCRNDGGSVLSIRNGAIPALPKHSVAVKMVKRYTGTLGSPHLLLLTPGPWILNGEEDCGSNLASLTDPSTLELVDTITLDNNNAALFNFTSTQSDFNPVLCYKFGEENFKLYSDISIAIGMIRAKSPQTGVKEIAVAGSRKNFTLLGTNLAAGDRVGWTTAIDLAVPCNNLSLLIPNPLNSIMTICRTSPASTLSCRVIFVKLGKACVSLLWEPFKLFTGLYLDVKSITNMRALVGSPTVAVAGALKTFLFDGDGVATGDFAKFVSSNDSDCTDPGVTLVNIIKEYDDYDEMAMFLYEISDRTTTGSFQTNPKAEGQNNVLVVNEPKRMTIDGVGISVKDTLKFVNSGTNNKDAECVDLPAQGRTDQRLQVATDLTVTLPFESGSNGSTWVLCYKFDDELYRLYPSIGITVKEITALLDYTFQDIAGLGGAATIGHRKQWKPVGSGIQEGDTVKIVPQSVTSSSECGKADANIATGTAIMTVGKKMVFSGTISAFPASTRDDEPFTYIRDFTLTTYGIISLDRSVVLESATTTAQVTGFRLSNTDEIGWTTSSTTCSTLLGRTEVSGMKANLYFSDSYSQLYLCYSFDRQPFDIFKTVTLTVAKAEIWTPQIVSIIADQTTEVVVSGTFGITQGTDQIAWVPSDVIECSTDAVALNKCHKVPVDCSSRGRGLFQREILAPRRAAESQRPIVFHWKLCYRFGSTPDFIMFGDVLCMVLNIVEVALLSMEATSTGAVMKFQFDGVGMQDFDAAKWVDASMATSDADCNALPAIGGSKISDVGNIYVRRREQRNGLCYRFLGHSFKLYANIPVQDLTTSRASIGQTTASNYDEEVVAAASDQFTASRDVATVSLTLDKDIMKSHLITELVAGSVVVNFQLLASDNPANPSVNEAVQDLHRQLLDTSSNLLTSSTVVVKNPTTALHVTVTSVPAPTTSSVAIQALGYQSNGLFSFVRSIYSVTEKSSKLVIPVIRLQGTSSVVSITVQVQTAGTTAVYDKDYAFPASTTFDESMKLLRLRFDIGDSLGTLELDILDNDAKEAHFKTISLALLDPSTSGTSLGSTKGLWFLHGQLDHPDKQRDLLQGWQVVANGESPVRVDGNGIFAVDDVLGEAEYNQKCDLAAPTGVCTYACELGGGLTSSGGLESSYNVLSLSGDDYATSMNGVSAFPSEAFTVSLWVKTTQSDPNACLYSYAVSSVTAPAVPLALCNPSNLQLFINAESDVSGLKTFVNISDNAWHFLAVTWSSEDGRVRVFDNGMLAFDGGPYRGGKTLESNGFFVAGQLVLSSASKTPCTVGAEALSQSYTATSTSGGLFVATTEDVSCMWRPTADPACPRVVTDTDTFRASGRTLMATSACQQWSCAWVEFRHLPPIAAGSCEEPRSTALQQAQHVQLTSIPASNTANTSTSYSCLLRGEVPRLDATFPCGPVFSNIWHFSASATFVSTLKTAYGGRLQYRLLAPSFNGSPRPRRGQVSIFSTNSDGDLTQISAALGSFDLPSASHWTYYSVVLREDFGWITEPDGTPYGSEALQRSGFEVTSGATTPLDQDRGSLSQRRRAVRTMTRQKLRILDVLLWAEAYNQSQNYMLPSFHSSSDELCSQKCWSWRVIGSGSVGIRVLISS
ncbi:Concanavalin A-like lectin/glucanase domain [Phytophthora cactorum]|nr:Concanavalin A-like lectin/glucanase domain [Phytophthora cactorum]